MEPKFLACVENLHFLDSHNYLPMSLNKCPNHFISMQVGLLPPIFIKFKNFGLSGPSSRTQVLWGDERAKCLKWYGFPKYYIRE